MLATALAALALFVSAETPPSGTAPEAPAAAPAPAQAAVPAKPKKVCQKISEVSGSRLSKKVCFTEKPKAEAPAQTTGAGQPAL
ncbi:hypothetical protein [Phenylobacterium sp.]|uniref:hypothetical protein n=1 Tax=Phenylobacterium sp. TaxID=1871053 RepID=UPI00391AA588